MSRSRNEWDAYTSAVEHIGNGMYSITSYAEIKRITIPLPDGKMLFISVNNKPMKNAKNTSYGHLVEMGEILSIVEFVNLKIFNHIKLKSFHFLILYGY